MERNLKYLVGLRNFDRVFVNITKEDLEQNPGADPTEIYVNNFNEIKKAYYRAVNMQRLFTVLKTLLGIVIAILIPIVVLFVFLLVNSIEAFDPVTNNVLVTILFILIGLAAIAGSEKLLFEAVKDLWTGPFSSFYWLDDTQDDMMKLLECYVINPLIAHRLGLSYDYKYFRYKDTERFEVEHRYFEHYFSKENLTLSDTPFGTKVEITVPKRFTDPVTVRKKFITSDLPVNAIENIDHIRIAKDYDVMCADKTAAFSTLTLVRLDSIANKELDVKCAEFSDYSIHVDAAGRYEKADIYRYLKAHTTLKVDKAQLMIEQNAENLLYFLNILDDLIKG